MGGGSKPSVMTLPPPASLFPEQTAAYLDMLKGLGPQALEIFGRVGQATQLGYTGAPTQLGYQGAPTGLGYREGAPTQLGYKGGAPTQLGYDPNFNLTQAAEIMRVAGKRQADIGRANIMGQFGHLGLAAGTPAASGVAEYEGQLARDQLALLQQLQLGYEPLKLGAAQAQAGLVEAERGRGLMAAKTQAELEEASKGRGLEAARAQAEISLRDKERELAALVEQGKLTEAEKNRQLDALKEQARLEEAGRARELATAMTWQDMIREIALSFYPTGQVVGGTPGQGAAYAQAGASGIMAMAMLLSALCWIAAAIYGPYTPEFYAARRFIAIKWRGRTANIVRRLYLKYGPVVAPYVARSRLLKALLRPLFNVAVRKGR